MIEIRGRSTIKMGLAWTKVFKLRKNGGVDHIDLSSASAITVSFLKSDNTTWHTETLAGGGVARVSGTTGDISVSLSAAETATLKEGLNQNIEITWTISGVSDGLILEKCLDVKDVGNL